MYVFEACHSRELRKASSEKKTMTLFEIRLHTFKGHQTQGLWRRADSVMWTLLKTRWSTVSPRNRHLLVVFSVRLFSNQALVLPTYKIVGEQKSIGIVTRLIFKCPAHPFSCVFILCPIGRLRLVTYPYVHQSVSPV